jgi:predicted NBD/HSP70 family sugar kinase
MPENPIIIGIDGGASKVSGWIIQYNASDDSFTLSDHHAELGYASCNGFILDFTPVSLQIQLQERQTNSINLTDQEIQQGATYIETCARVIELLARDQEKHSFLVGIGMPGLKTDDRRGLSAVANGPRIPQYAEKIENELKSAHIPLAAPIAHIGSDADYCGIGETYAREGSFRDISNGYYLGGGTGTADALRLRGNLVPFDQAKNWLAKTWELKNDIGVSLEKYASASGLQFIYSNKSERKVEDLNRHKIYPTHIADLALKGETSAIETFEEAAKYLSLLLYERICTIYCGTQNIFTFVNPNREVLNKNHPYRNELLQRLVIGQRLGDLLGSPTGEKVLTIPLIENLSNLIENSSCLSEQAKSHYLENKRLRKERLIFSLVREAPALGAGIDAYLVYNG